jgi:hypothetical protein
MFGFFTQELSGMRCLICAHKVSKRDKKYIKACKTSGMPVAELCSSCVINRNKVVAKMGGNK